jgi:FG-GAP-like repeat
MSISRKFPALLGAAFAALVAAPASASADLTFATSSFGAGGSPDSVAMDDFDGDGRRDLAVTNSTAGTVSVLKGTGGGAFGPPAAFPVGAGPVSVDAADFDADGRGDLAVANSGGGVSVLLGTGSGSFGPATTYPAGKSPSSVAAGDFNGDGHMDLAVANLYPPSVFAPATVSVLLGTSTGTFGTTTDFPVAGDTPTSLAVGDFNGDGRRDLAIAGGGGNRVSILLGAGDGTFGEATHFATGPFPSSVAVGDFNGDGNQDLVTADEEGDGASVLLGTGAGTFGAAVTYPSGDGPESVTVGDFNGDRRQDLASANHLSNDVVVRLGSGTGTFGGSYRLAVGSRPTALTAGDVNGDLVDDLAVANGGAGTVSILRDAPTADVSPPSLQFASPGEPGAVSAPQAITIVNNGSAPLAVSGFAIGGANPGDFFTSTDTCYAAIPPGGSCSAQVRFVPQAEGARSATLTVASNAATTSAVSLSGGADQPPPQAQAPAPPPQAQAPTKTKRVPVRLVSCRRTSDGRRRCRTRRIRATVDLALPRGARVSVSRHGVVYASGTANRDGLELRDRRHLRNGRYRLTVRHRRGGGPVTTRGTITIRGL